MANHYVVHLKLNIECQLELKNKKKITRKNKIKTLMNSPNV